MNEENREIIEDNHKKTSIKKPIKTDPFTKTNDEKIDRIKIHFDIITEHLGWYLC